MTSKPNFLWPTNLESRSGKKFWKGLKEGKFLAPRCKNCGELFFPPRPYCPACLCGDLQWEELSGKGFLYSWTEVYFALPEFEPPFLLGLVELAEGVGRILAKINGAKAEELQIGMPLQIKIGTPTENFALYYVEPSRED
jgi:uncharacterized OB-fold protein